MTWKQHSAKLITHIDGHSIELVSGSWAEPYEISPKIIKGTESMTSVRLIREGMDFALALKRKKLEFS